MHARWPPTLRRKACFLPARWGGAPQNCCTCHIAERTCCRGVACWGTLCCRSNSTCRRPMVLLKAQKSAPQHVPHLPMLAAPPPPQVINNACATQAIVNVLMNRPELDIGAELTQLRDFTTGFPPEMKGGAHSAAGEVRGRHAGLAAAAFTCPPACGAASAASLAPCIVCSNQDGDLKLNCTAFTVQAWQSATASASAPCTIRSHRRSPSCQRCGRNIAQSACCAVPAEAVQPAAHTVWCFVHYLQERDDEKGEAFHFIAYLPVK